MTNGTKIFRITIATLLGLTMIFAAAFFFLFVKYIEKDMKGVSYDITVAGVEVTRDNRNDILGDGTVRYDELNNVLVFNNADIKFDQTVVYSRTDLLIQLIGENKITMVGEYVPSIYVAGYLLSYDLVIFGEGTLTIDYEGTASEAMGIFAKDLRIESDVTINMPDSTNIVNGIYCESSLTLAGGATVTVNNGAGKYSSALKARTNINIEAGATLNVSVRGGTTDTCKGLVVGGSLIVWDGAALSVSMDDQAALKSECLNVAGLMSIGRNSKVTASAKKAHAVECYGSIEMNSGASLIASSDREGEDILCYGALLNYGATVSGEAEIFGGVHTKEKQDN